MPGRGPARRIAGLRLAKACGLRIDDVDFMRGSITPAVQYPAEPLKTETSRTAIPVPQVLALELAAHVRDHPGPTLLTNEIGHQLGPWALGHAFRGARTTVDGLPAGFRYHDLRHYLRLAPDRLRRRREDRPSPATARLGEDHPRHVRAPMARPGRVDESRSGGSLRRSS